MLSDSARETMDETDKKPQVLVTGAAGNAGRAVSRLLFEEGYALRLADSGAPPDEDLELGHWMRCDTRTPDDVRRAVEGVDAVVHLAAWHCAHQPPVSDATIFAVNVDGTFNVLEAARDQGVKALTFASSMAYGWGSVYSMTKVVGEEMCRAFHEMTGAHVAMLRYHEFTPCTYLRFGSRLLRNGVDRQDVARATVASVRATLEGRTGLFETIVHTAHNLPPQVQENFCELGPDWCEDQIPGSRWLLERYELDLPIQVEQHDLGEAERVLGWKPQVNFQSFLRSLEDRSARGQDLRKLQVPGELPR